MITLLMSDNMLFIADIIYPIIVLFNIFNCLLYINAE